MAKKNEATEAAVKDDAPKLSAIDRLKEQLAAAERKAAARNQKKIDALKLNIYKAGRRINVLDEQASSWLRELGALTSDQEVSDVHENQFIQCIDPTLTDSADSADDGTTQDE